VFLNELNKAEFACTYYLSFSKIVDDFKLQTPDGAVYLKLKSSNFPVFRGS